MKKIVEAPENVVFFNQKSRDMWLATQAAERDLVYVYCPDLGVDGLIMTQEAAALFLDAVPKDVLVSTNPIDAVTAANLFDVVYTSEDVPNMAGVRRQLVP